MFCSFYDTVFFLEFLGSVLGFVVSVYGRMEMISANSEETRGPGRKSTSRWTVILSWTMLGALIIFLGFFPWYSLFVSQNLRLMKDFGIRAKKGFFPSELRLFLVNAV